MVYDQTKPLIRTFPAAAEIAVPDGESPPQGPVPQDLLVQLFYLGNQLIKLIAAQSALIPDKTVGVKCGLHFKKTKPASERVVDHGQTTVRGIHHPDYIQIFGNGKGRPL